MRITIVGLGLIGGSLGMAVKRRRPSIRITGFSRKSSTLRQALRRRAIDEGIGDLERAVRRADLVVLATPVDRIVPLARRCAKVMPKGSVITDVGSTKGAIVSALRTLPRGIAFVGGHPIAGSERRGIGAADAKLFDGSLCILTPTAATPKAALRTVQALWRPLVGKIVVISPARHDAALAGISHLPHLLASALLQTVQRPPLPRTPRSFLDMTRITLSDPDLWDDIFATNRPALLVRMDAFTAQWRRLRALVRRGDRAALRALLTRSRALRHALEE